MRGRDLRDQAKKNRIESRVDFRGALAGSDLVEFYGSVDLVVVPSKRTERWCEQFGRVVLEAGACGVPVAVSESGELTNVVRAIGSGWTFREGDVDALSRIIDRLAGDPDEARRAGDRAFLGVRELFSEERVVDQLADAIVRVTSH